MSVTVGVVGELTANLTAALQMAGAKGTEQVKSEDDVTESSHVIVVQRSAAMRFEQALRKRMEEGQPTMLVGDSAVLVKWVTPSSVIEPVSTPKEITQTWNAYDADPRCKFLKPGTAYFPASTECLKAIPLGWFGAWTTPLTQDSVVAGLEHNAVVATQFEPEISSTQGRSTLMRWVKHKQQQPSSTAPSEPKRKANVAVLLTVNTTTVDIGTADQVPTQNLAQCDLPSAWEACGSDYLVTVLGEQGSQQGLIETAQTCMVKSAIPVVAEATDKSSVEELLRAGVSQIIIDSDKTGAEELSQAVPSSKMLGMVTIQAEGDTDESEHVEKLNKLRPFGVVLRFVSTDFTNDNAVSKIANVINLAASTFRDVWILAENMHLSSMIRLAEASNATHFIRYPLELGAAPAKVKGAMLTSEIETRVQPSGMQYSSTNLQCVIPALEVKNGSVSTGKGVSSTTDVAAAVDSYSVVGDVAVINVDTSLGLSDGAATRELMKPLFRKYNIRFGGGVRTVDDALSILNEGAAKVIIGSAANREFLSQLPRDRLVVSIDAVFSEATGHETGSWLTSDGKPLTKLITDLCDVAGHFQVTFLEPSMPGLDLTLVMKLAATCKASKVGLTVAGPVRTPKEIAVLDEMGVECLISTSVLGTPQLPLSTAITSVIKTDRQDGLYPTVVIDSSNGRALGMCYSSTESIREAIKRKRGTYWSRTRGLWVKGETSGDVQELVGIAMDCDRDCLLFTVKQAGTGFCHRHQQTCFGPATGFDKLMATLQQRKASAPQGSYTKRLFEDATLLRAKLMEEATELADSPNADNCAFEAADLIYFAFVRCVAMGVDMSEIQKNLDFKGRKVHRRPGNAKPQFLQNQN
eukprot:TRINITY_DN4092_c1_g2_i1.p1 TRINITY_DN4092_c1_g2~~TRINITY_DN4092_c1_g2_i1.p1  ORF type:complete len:882 (+),score=145.11 TRINITY_DN4092_c1_g2_i1:58-2646(+)